MSIVATVERNFGKGNGFTASIGDVREHGATAAEAKSNAEAQALAALVWVAPVVVTTATRVLVAYMQLGRPVYDVTDYDGHRQVSTATGETFAECVAAMRRHAEQYRADECAAVA